MKFNITESINHLNNYITSYKENLDNIDKETYLNNYITSYKENLDNIDKETYLNNILYYLGISINKDKYSGDAGYTLFKEDLILFIVVHDHISLEYLLKMCFYGEDQDEN